MLEVRLHGALAEFGEVWNLEVASPAEAVRAIATMKPDFLKAIGSLDGAGYVFKVSTPVHDYVEGELQMTLGAQQRLDIIPIVRGASAGVRFVVGATLIAASFALGGPIGASATWYSMAAFNVGLSLALGSIVEWLTPVQRATSTDNLQSWSIAGADANIEQGYPVPVIYGEVLAPAYAISGGVSTAKIDGGQTGPTASIGGKVENSAVYYGHVENPSVEFLLTSGYTGMADPTATGWMYTGFVGADVQLIPQGRNIRVKVTYIGPADFGFSQSYYGTVSLLVTGRDLQNTHSPVNAGTSVNCTAHLMCY